MRDVTRQNEPSPILIMGTDTVSLERRESAQVPFPSPRSASDLSDSALPPELQWPRWEWKDVRNKTSAFVLATVAVVGFLIQSWTDAPSWFNALVILFAVVLSVAFSGCRHLIERRRVAMRWVDQFPSLLVRAAALESRAEGREQVVERQATQIARLSEQVLGLEQRVADITSGLERAVSEIITRDQYEITKVSCVDGKVNLLLRRKATERLPDGARLEIVETDADGTSGVLGQCEVKRMIEDQYFAIATDADEVWLGYIRLQPNCTYSPSTNVAARVIS